MKVQTLLLLAPVVSGLRDDPLPDSIPVTAEICNSSSPLQQWDIQGENIVLRQFSTKCLDISGYNTDDESPVQEFSCHPEDKDPSHQNQQWSFDQDSGLISVPHDGTAQGKVLDLSNYGADGPGSTVWIFKKEGTKNQQWKYDNSTGLFESQQDRYTEGKLCLAAEQAPPAPRPCDIEPGKSQPWCDATLDTEKRLDDLISRIPADEIVGLFDNTGKGVPSLNIPAYQWWSEALHGVANSPGVKFGGDLPNATSFPQVVTTSASFNKTLFKSIGEVISTEARAFNNAGQAGNTFWTPNINIFRDPRWGRGQETPGEDPTVNAGYATNFIQGMQEGESWPKYIKASACLKHYAAYNLERWNGVDRHHFNAVVTAQDMNDTYLPAFEAGVVDGAASGIMCSYNAVNGIPSCANKWLLTDLARNTWGFNGYITSDCGAVNDVQNSHHYFNNSDATSYGVLSAGMDQDCGGFLGSNLEAAIKDGSVPKDTYETAMRNMFRMRIRLGQFDPLSSQPYSKYTADDVDTPYAQQLALDAARQGMVLLKNENDALPLKASSIKTLALVGPQSQATNTMQGNYNGVAPYLISPQQGLQTALGSDVKIDYVAGCDIDSKDTSGFSAAETAAAGADATVIMVGMTQAQESEGHDRTSIDLPGVQHDFISKVADAANGKPVIVVVMSGGAVDISQERNNDKVNGILFVGYPGQSGGTAIAETLVGTNNPAGRLTQTFYYSNFTDDVSMFDMNMRPNETSGYPGRTHRFFTGRTVYNFGDGLSYSSFSVSPNTPMKLTVPLADVQGAVDNWSVGAPRNRTSADVAVSVRVHNEGPLRGSRAVLGYLVPPGAGQNGRPLRELAAFERVHDLDVGSSEDVEVSFDYLSLTHVDVDGNRYAEAGDWTLKIDDDAEITIAVV